MMKKFTFCMMLCSILASCFNYENDVVEECYNQEQPTITFEGFKFSDDTRAFLVSDNGDFYIDYGCSKYDFEPNLGLIGTAMGNNTNLRLDVSCNGTSKNSYYFLKYPIDSIPNSGYKVYHPYQYSYGHNMRIPFRCDSLIQFSNNNYGHINKYIIMLSESFFLKNDNRNSFKCSLSPVMSILRLKLTSKNTHTWKQVSIEDWGEKCSLTSKAYYNPFENDVKKGFCKDSVMTDKLTVFLNNGITTNELIVYFPLKPSNYRSLNVKAVDDEGVTHIFTSVPEMNLSAGVIVDIWVKHIATMTDTIHPYVIINDAVWANSNAGIDQNNPNGIACNINQKDQDCKSLWGNEWVLPSESDWQNLFIRTTLKNFYNPEDNKNYMRIKDRFGRFMFLPLRDCFLDYWTSDSYDSQNQGNSTHAYAIGIEPSYTFGNQVIFMRSDAYIKSELFVRYIHRLDE